MSGPAASSTFALAKPVSPEALHTLRGKVARSIADGARTVALEIDDVVVLDSPVISGLIEILRDARECGATVTLRAERKGILETLRITALDRVFTIESRGAGVAPPSPRRGQTAPDRRPAP